MNDCFLEYISSQHLHKRVRNGVQCVRVREKQPEYRNLCVCLASAEVWVQDLQTFEETGGGTKSPG